MSIPNAFISYSHDSPEHKSWVLDLATRLRSSGVDAVIDQWDLRPSDDLAWVSMKCNYSACVPDLPGCVATGVTVEETETSIREAIEFHLDGMREDGLVIPIPSSRVEYVEVAT